MAFQAPKTVAGHNLFEVVSALQKSIRRGELDDALYWTTDMFLSNFAEYCWRRLLVISSEDIGLASPEAPAIIRSLRDTYLDMRGRSPKYAPERLMLFNAVAFLCTAPKSRLIDHALIYHFKNHDQLYRDIPDYALDRHTSRGRTKRRGAEHFYTEGIKLAPFADDVEHEVLGEVDQGVDRYRELARSVDSYDDPPFPEAKKTNSSKERKKTAVGKDECPHGQADWRDCLICIAEREGDG